MKIFKKGLISISSDIVDVLYPVTCLVCGDRMANRRHLCRYCIENAFIPSENSGNEASTGLILPEWISMQETLWEFDKGGFLQDVLHQLKYGGLSVLGISLGEELGKKLKNHSWMKIDDCTLIVPVPLHPARQRKRGYNQSSLIAEGISRVTGAAIAEEKTVVRVKNTTTQTGLGADIRKKNISGAFQIQKETLLKDRDILLVDDVITTGATITEMAEKIKHHSGQIGMATIARA